MIALLIGLSRRNMIELRRYWFDTIFSFVGIFLLFTMVFWGARGIGGADVRHGETLPAIVIGFVVLTVVLGSYFTMSVWVTQEAALGTLEQLAMSPFGLLGVLVAEYAASLWFQVALITVMLLASEAVSGQWLHIDLVTLGPLLGLLLVQMLGLGLAMGGAAIVFKRVASLNNLMQFVFFALIAVPIVDDPWVRYLPISLTNDLIRQSTVRSTGLLDLDQGDVVAAVALSAAYLAVGVAVFLRMERVARDRGLIGVH